MFFLLIESHILCIYMYISFNLGIVFSVDNQCFTLRVREEGCKQGNNDEISHHCFSELSQVNCWQLGAPFKSELAVE